MSKLPDSHLRVIDCSSLKSVGVDLGFLGRIYLNSYVETVRPMLALGLVGGSSVFLSQNFSYIKTLVDNTFKPSIFVNHRFNCNLVIRISKPTFTVVFCLADLAVKPFSTR